MLLLSTVNELVTAGWVLLCCAAALIVNEGVSPEGRIRLFAAVP